MRLLMALLVLMFGVCVQVLAQSGGTPLRVAIAGDAPPYVIDGATSGLEVDIVRQSLPGYALEFVQMGFAETAPALKQGMVQAAVNVMKKKDDGLFYSNDMISFANYAIAKAGAGVKIGSIADLAGKKIVTWQGAPQYFGPEFKKMFGPNGPQRQNLMQAQTARDLVAQFWKMPNAVAVVDMALFKYYSNKMGHTMAQVDLFQVFPLLTDFRVGFRDRKVRDDFNRGLAELCSSGRYKALLKKYDVMQKQDICR
ncbi:transporter substrate-binding domain-containing protein [Microbulbifer sp. OS29]|uniref:Transporter substrate-binding domain-containing protein n=1 Tax=Microbulbifer okhotskensis TaxID=2926617 RepID=A0A9X2ENV1_9GAMM|nr:transporter substrate-binding domain-containing protein [Microbulbifer okhotskensis]MCO1335035.1 transporter substrate-binding domain-containing protein [Microbulbifer okhotskensis]